jgi:nicotinamidase-related amidase
MTHLLESQAMKKPALLVIDMLNDFLDQWAACPTPI